MAFFGPVALSIQVMTQVMPGVVGRPVAGRGPTPVWQWDKAPDRHDVARVFPADFPANLQSFGAMECVLGPDRRPKDCHTTGFGDPRLSAALLKLADRFQGPPASVANGERISISLNFRSAAQTVGAPRFVSGPDDLKGETAEWGEPPTLEKIAKAAPDHFTGGRFGMVECEVGAGGLLKACHIFTYAKAPRPRCFHGGGDDVCTAEELARFKPAPELTALAETVRAPITGPDGKPTTGRTVRFLVNLDLMMAQPLQIAPPPPPPLIRQNPRTFHIS